MTQAPAIKAPGLADRKGYKLYFMPSQSEYGDANHCIVYMLPWIIQVKLKFDFVYLAVHLINALHIKFGGLE